MQENFLIWKYASNQGRRHRNLSAGASDWNKGAWGSQCKFREGRHDTANVKILRNLGEPKRVFGEPGGARLPQAPPVATPLLKPPLVAYFERNALCNFDKMILGYVKTIMDSPALPISFRNNHRRLRKFHRSRDCAKWQLLGQIRQIWGVIVRQWW